MKKNKDHQNSILRYVLVKITLIVFCGATICIGQFIKSFWYDSMAPLETVQQQLTVDASKINQLNDDGLSALMVAANEDNEALARLLLEHGADVNVRAMTDNLLPNVLGSTALHFAVLNGNTGMVKLLLEHGADLYYVNNEGNTSLHYLSFVGSPDLQKNIFSILMAAGANLNIQNDEGIIPLYWLIEQNNDGIIREATTIFGDFLNYTLTSNTGETLAEHAQSLGKEVLTPFFEHTDNTTLGLIQDQDANVRNKQGYAGVHLAAIQGNPDYMKKLIDRGASLMLLDPKHGDTPLYLAAMFGFVNVVRVILEHELRQGHVSAVATAINRLGRTIPMALLGVRNLSDRMALFKDVVRLGAPLNARDHDGNAVLHLSVMRGDVDWIKILLREFGEELDLTLKNNAGQTPHDIAVQRGYSDIAALL